MNLPGRIAAPASLRENGGCPMLSMFYRSHSRSLLIAVALTLPLLRYQSDHIPSNNEIETWLPEQSEVREVYNRFTSQFGAEEVVLIGLVNRQSDDPLVEALVGRLERLPAVRKCWSPSSLGKIMLELGVSQAEIDKRLTGLTQTRSGQMIGMIVSLSEEGVKDRVQAVNAIQRELDYCRVPGEDVLLTGAPVIVAELDRLGSTNANKRFFSATIGLCALLLFYLLRDWRLTLGTSALTVFAVYLTNTLVKWLGGEMNFLLSALPVMVMVFTLAVSVHYLNYYKICRYRKDPVVEALKKSFRPCFWATLTTAIGLLSLMVNDMGPVRQFGWAASVGAGVAMISALLLMPALVTLFPLTPRHDEQQRDTLARLGSWIILHSKQVALVTSLLVLVTSLGLPLLHSHIDPLDFLPADSQVIRDLLTIEEDLTPTESIEGIVDFGIEKRPFFEKLEIVREIQREIDDDPGVQHAMSLASFFPAELPGSAIDAMRLLDKASSQGTQSDFLSAGQRYWRISARVRGTPLEKQRIFHRLQKLSDRYPVEFTGIAPLIAQAQHDIFQGFWESFAMALVIITGVMVLSLRSWKIALVAMIPNLTPICIVFGLLGWSDYPVDIGMMMTASIALGIAVDGTFHFVMAYKRGRRQHGHSRRAARCALFHTGAPIFQAAVIASIGMLALTMSQFAPTYRFGMLMATLLLAALIGDLVLLPALLAICPNSRHYAILSRNRQKKRHGVRHATPKTTVDYPEVNAA